MLDARVGKGDRCRCTDSCVEFDIACTLFSGSAVTSNADPHAMTGRNVSMSTLRHGKRAPSQHYTVEAHEYSRGKSKPLDKTLPREHGHKKVLPTILLGLGNG